MGNAVLIKICGSNYILVWTSKLLEKLRFAPPFAKVFPGLQAFGRKQHPAGQPGQDHIKTI